MHRVGDIVNVYEDPFDETKPEGKARIVEVTDVTPIDGVGHYLVEFLDDELGDPRVHRWIKDAS